MRKYFNLHKAGFGTLIGTLIAVAVMCILMFLVIKIYIMKPKGMDTETQETLRQNDIDPSNYKTIIDTTRQKLNAISEQEKHRYDGMEGMY